MSKNKSNFYPDVKYIKRKGSVKLRILWWFLFPCAIAVVVLLAMFFSGLIAGGDLAFWHRYNLKIGSVTYYGLSFGTYDDLDKAKEVANGTVLQGAAGYIWQDSDKYVVLGNIYMSYDDCKTVIDNITGTNYSMNIYTIKVDNLRKNLDEHEIVSDSYSYLIDTIKMLYDTSMDLDTKKMTNIQASSVLNTQKSDGMIQKDTASMYQLSSSSEYVSRCIQSLQHTIDTLDDLVYKLIQDESAGYSIRYALCSSVQNVYDCVRDMKKI